MTIADKIKLALMIVLLCWFMLVFRLGAAENEEFETEEIIYEKEKEE